MIKKEFKDYTPEDWDVFIKDGLEDDKAWNLYLQGKAPEHAKIEGLQTQVSTLIQSGETVNQILDQLKPVQRFFKDLEKEPAPSKLSKKEREQKEDEQRQAAIKAKAMKKQKKETK